MKDKYCEHCYPSNNRHTKEKIESFFDFYLSLPLYLISIFSFKKHLSPFILKTVVSIACAFKHAKLTKDIKRSSLNNGLLVLWDEALNRNLNIYNIEFFNHSTQYFLLKYRQKKYIFDRNPVYLLNKKLINPNNAKKYDDKAIFKKILLKHRFPCPKGKAFFSSKAAFKYGINVLGFPLTVKPAISSFSRHVILNVTTAHDLKNAITIAKEINYKIIIEEYVKGIAHRVTLINHEIVGCTKREASAIIGDGQLTIEKLIDQKNSHPWRGKPYQINYSLHAIEKNSHLKKILAKQQVDLKTVLKKDAKIYLSDKMNSGNGADISNVTNLIHPENKKLFLSLNATLNLCLLGLDFICEDVALPWNKQHFAIIENNSLPYIDAHHYPSQGKPINVAGYVWDFVLKNL